MSEKTVLLPGAQEAGNGKDKKLTLRQRRLVESNLEFVAQLARRVAATMPHSIDVEDLVQDGVIGMMDAARRFDASRGVKFQTFAERRIRGAMIDALRKDAWPRGVRKQRRELEAAREELRRELGEEPSLSDLAARVQMDEKCFERWIVRIKVIESTSPLADNDRVDQSLLPQALIPPEPEQPDVACEREETNARVRAAIATLPPREQRVIELYYYGEATMKQIGAMIGVNESRVSQLHARAMRQLRDAFGVQSGEIALTKFKIVARGNRQAPESLTNETLRLTLAPVHLVERGPLSKLTFPLLRPGRGEPESRLFLDEGAKTQTGS